MNCMNCSGLGLGSVSVSVSVSVPGLVSGLGFVQ